MKFRLRFPQYAWGVLIYMVFVVIWGAVVRASGSGDGCGKHWPVCGDHLIPTFQRLATLIEFSHRASTGLMLPLIGGLVFWAHRAYTRFHPVRRGAILALLFTLLEGAFGAVLVKMGWVTGSHALGRVIMMPLHSCNTFLLLACLALTAWWSEGRPTFTFRQSGRLGTLLAAACAAALLLTVSGSLAALADSLYHATSFAAALRQDFDTSAPFLLRLRLSHPLLSLAVGGFALWVARQAAVQRPTPDTQRYAHLVTLLFLGEIGAGFLNAAFLAPIPMQLLHLLLADLLWLTLVLLTASALAQRYSLSEDFNR